MTRGLRVALLYNLKHHMTAAEDAPVDVLAEYDSIETVEGLAEALRSAGHSVVSMEADRSLLDTLRSERPEICFNIAEGLGGDAREAQVPALLEMLGVPYTGSRVLTHALSLDKVATKRIWRDHGLPTAPFQVFVRGDEPLDVGLVFPLFVKPAREGSGMGVSPESLVHDEPALRRQVGRMIQGYHQPALVESFLSGREFTMGILGYSAVPGRPPRSALYDVQGYHVLPALEIDVSPVTEAHGIYTGYVKGERPLDSNYLCPAPMDADLAAELRRLTISSFEALYGLDVARVDIRLGSDGRPYLMEINTLPGINPTYSDIVIAARAEGLSYESLVNEVLNLAAERYGLPSSCRM